MEWTKSKYFTVLVNVCRLVLSLMLVVSGFVKAVDPVGSMYKLREYVTAFSVELFSDDWLLFFGILQAVLEFLLGVFLLMGVYRRVVANVVPAVMFFFTVLTAVIYYGGDVKDCGCFGEAVTLTNGETFAKNIFFLLLSIPLLAGRRNFVFNISSKSRWMVTLFALFYIAAVEILSLSHLPVVDFGRYPVGASLREMAQGTPGEYRIVYEYERGGERWELPEGELPDSSWVCVGSRSMLVKEGTLPVLSNFSVVDWEEDSDFSEELLADTGYVCVVAVERVEEASVSRVDKINDMYDYCLEKGVPFYVTTASENEDVELWRKRTGAEYPVFWTDEAVLREMIRSNPGVLLLKDGVIVGKWNVADLPAVEEFEASPTRMPDRLPSIVGAMRGWRFWMLLLVVPLLFIAAVDALACRGARKSGAANDVSSAGEVPSVESGCDEK